ncbi:MAG: hypothetical protein JOS17DRAFT_764642 [Linnemannia elongata]|nr:MAG: hypothetical protein JOS17DRAFT_764642 [Linnemannia elongata]
MWGLVVLEVLHAGVYVALGMREGLVRVSNSSDIMHFIRHSNQDLLSMSGTRVLSAVLLVRLLLILVETVRSKEPKPQPDNPEASRNRRRSHRSLGRRTEVSILRRNNSTVESIPDLEPLHCGRQETRGH